MILKLHEIKKRFGATVALDGVNIELKKGEVHSLVGENGAGKSTLMNILSGKFSADSGWMEINGQAYQPTNPLDARRRGIALIHQELSLMPHLTVAENIMIGLENSSFGWLDRKDLNQSARAVLQNFEHSDVTPETIVGNLPIAAQQVVEICRAIAAKAEIILMDEPTSSLQRDDVKHLFTLIRRLQSQGISIIYISHFLEELREIADSFTVLRDGKSVATGSMAKTADDFLIAKMVGREMGDLFPTRTVAGQGEIVLEVRNLSAPPKLKSASFDLRGGEVFGIAGLMGSGRAELVRAIFGLDKVESGEIEIRGISRQVGGQNPARRLAQGIGYVSEDRKGEGLGIELSIADNLTITKFDTCANFGWLNPRNRKNRQMILVKRIGIKTLTSAQAVGSLSGGNQQKVAIGRVIHQNAEIILLDEPTRGIDIGSKAQVYQTIAELAEQGKAVLMISSYLPELFGMCQRLAVMSRGYLSEARKIDEWSPESVMQAAIGTGEK